MPPTAARRRVVHKADFQRLLGVVPGWRSAHFAVHHVSIADLGRPGAGAAALDDKLSTGLERSMHQSVDNIVLPGRLGVVIPKRHARRAVTRNLLRRLVRAVFEQPAAVLAPGDWLVRLRSPFAPSAFPSAASERLRAAARSELEALRSRIARVD